MTKEEKIKESYREYWETVKDHVDENGWFVKDAFQMIDYHDLVSTIDFVHDHSTDEMQPKEIYGIKDNNGWIKVNSEEDLPKTNGMYWTIAKFNEVCANTWGMLGKSEFTFDNGHVTHYQPIIKPNIPIY